MNQKTILLVEDDENQVTLALRAMRQHGIVEEAGSVVVVGDGEEAIEYLFKGRQSGQQAEHMPEFVLLDVDLPGIDGLQVLEQLRENERTELLPVVLFSSSGEHSKVVQGYKLGANSYVTKPTNFDEFSEAMQYLGWYWLNINESPLN